MKKIVKPGSIVTLSKLSPHRPFSHLHLQEEPVMDSPSLVIYCTCPDQATAERIAEALVSERLAACVNLVPGTDLNLSLAGPNPARC
jgi:hypothetical protein